MLTKWRQALNLGILTWDPLFIPARLGAFDQHCFKIFKFNLKS